MLLRFLRACREAKVPGRPGPNVVRLVGSTDGPVRGHDDQPAAGGDLGAVHVRGDAGPDLKNPVPKGREARWLTCR